MYIKLLVEGKVPDDQAILDSISNLVNTIGHAGPMPFVEVKVNDGDTCEKLCYPGDTAEREQV